MFNPGDDVIFRREKLTKAMLEEYGTSAVYLSYTVARQHGNTVFLKSKIGFEFDVCADDIQLKPDNFNQAAFIEPFLHVIKKMELAS